MSKRSRYNCLLLLFYIVNNIQKTDTIKIYDKQRDCFEDCEAVFLDCKLIF